MEGSDREQDRYRTGSDREKRGEREWRKDRLEKTQKQN